MHNAYVYTILPIGHIQYNLFFAQLQIKYLTVYKRNLLSCLHAIPAYYRRSSACLTIACAILSIAQCTQCIQCTLFYTFQFSLFSTAHVQYLLHVIWAHLQAHYCDHTADMYTTSTHTIQDPQVFIKCKYWLHATIATIVCITLVSMYMHCMAIKAVFMHASITL